MRPTSITRVSGGRLKVEWDDRHESIYALEQLREECPCAGCQGETVLLREYVPPPPDRTTPGRYELHNLTLVGAYAMQCEWGDGHSTGIYTWDRLRASCPCGACAAAAGHAHSTT
jgi:DUF971 family protein